MNVFFEEYKSYLNEKYKKNTAMSYISDLTKFTEELNIKTPSEISHVTAKTVKEYIDAMKNRGVAYTTLARMVASLKSFFKFCISMGILTEDLTKEAVVPQRQRKLPEILSFEEIVKILESPDASTIKGKRDRAMLEIMYATGAKVSEIINLKVNDVSLKNEVVIIDNGFEHRFVPIGKNAVEATNDYLLNGRSKITGAENSNVMFLNFYGEAITRQGFWKIIKSYIEKSGIKRNVTAKTLRHSFAIHLLDNGADVYSVSEMMGYNSVDSLKIYYEVMNNKIKDVYRKAHPRA